MKLVEPRWCESVFEDSPVNYGTLFVFIEVVGEKGDEVAMEVIVVSGGYDVFKLVAADMPHELSLDNVR